MKKYKPEDELCKLIWQDVERLILYKKIDYGTIWHNNNGEHSGTKLQRILAGKRAKEMGQLKGLLDYTCVEPAGGHFYIEIKVNNRLTDEQKQFIERMERRNIKCYVLKAKSDFEFTKVKNEFFEILTKHKVYNAR